jgi:ArsR family transcriptional regulator
MTIVVFIALNALYNIFRLVNMKKQSMSLLSGRIAQTLEVISSPARISILLCIGKSEACVCHLETALGWRQAYISQHLMALRKANILLDRRAGRYIYYRLANAALLDLLLDTARLSGLPAESISALINTQTYPTCECPQCAPILIATSSL